MTGDSRAVAMHQTGGLLELRAPVLDLPVSMFFAEWLFRFFHQDGASISVLDSDFVTCLANEMWWELWWVSTNPTLENACIFPFSLLDLYFLHEVLPNLLEEKRPWVMLSNSHLPSLSPGRAAVNYGCLKEPSWDQEDHAAEFRPKSNLQNCELNKWLLFLTTKCQDDSVCRNSELIHRLRE